MSALDSAAAPTRRPRKVPPSHAEINAYWEGVGSDELHRIFPRNPAPYIGWGEPFCFRCGWLAPVKEAADYPQGWSTARILDTTWNSVGAWLEKCHLHDHQFDGPNEPSNFVPMCPLCHEHQPECPTREDGIAFVNTAPPHQHLVWAMQMMTDALYRDRRPTGREDSLRALLRVQADAGAALTRGTDG